MSYVIELLDKQHERTGFDCGQPDLNDFIQRYALQQQKRHQNKTYVACTADKQVIGFYSLHVGSLAFAELPSEVQKRLARYPVPAVYIGRFAVDSRYQGKGLGKYLFAHALHRVCDISALAGVAVVVVEAKDNKAASFYASMDFRSLPDHPLKLFLPVADLVKANS